MLSILGRVWLCLGRALFLITPPAIGLRIVRELTVVLKSHLAETERQVAG
jgi:hypothetical protein